MQRIQTGIFWAVVLSETSHVFCCVLPTLFSVLSLLAGVGMISALPAPLVGLHEALHEWEIPVIVASGAILALGWGLHAYSLRLDSRQSCCVHGECAPSKRRSSVVLKIATVLFVVNVFVFAVFHRGLGFFEPSGPSSAGYEHAHDPSGMPEHR